MPVGLTDCTPGEACQWVDQELPKHTTRESIEQRLASERRLRESYARYPGLADNLPNSDWAHDELVRRLEQKLKTLK